MAKTVPIEVVVRVVRCEDGGTWTMSDAEFQRERAEAWHEGMTHALTWLGLKQYAEVMAKDNPHGRGK